MTAIAPATSSHRRYRLPCLVILPSLSLPPVDCCLGTSPIHAARLRPDPNAFQGNADVYIFDLIGGHCGAQPSVIWNDVTDITFSSGTLGRTTYPRPGRVVPPCTP